MFVTFHFTSTAQQVHLLILCLVSNVSSDEFMTPSRGNWVQLLHEHGHGVLVSPRGHQTKSISLQTSPPGDETTPATVKQRVTAV